MRPKAQFGVVLLALLRERGWSQKQLADRMGRPPSQVSGWVNGRMPWLSNRIVLAEALGLTVAELDAKVRAASEGPGGGTASHE